MCGFSGIYALEHPIGIDPIVLREMTDTIRHRGPDDEGYLLLNTANNNQFNAYREIRLSVGIIFFCFFRSFG